jgi:hypothetical protein
VLAKSLAARTHWPSSEALSAVLDVAAADALPAKKKSKKLTMMKRRMNAQRWK